jgi:hypothetical protein
MIAHRGTMEAITMADKDWREQVINLAEQPAGLTPASVGEAVVQPPLSIGAHVQPHFDVLELLPPGGAGRMRFLRERADNARHRLRASLGSPNEHPITHLDLLCVAGHQPGQLGRRGAKICVEVKLVGIALEDPRLHDRSHMPKDMQRPNSVRAGRHCRV